MLRRSLLIALVLALVVPSAAFAQQDNQENEQPPAPTSQPAPPFQPLPPPQPTPVPTAEP